ncbi:hypothetical protein ABFS82_06G014000 [Erythranthe guttata]
MANNDELQIKKNVEAQFVEMMVPLYSYGCANKIKKALANVKGIYSVSVDLQQQKVTVWGICDKYDVVSIVKNKRKRARLWDSDQDHCNQNQLVDQESYSLPSSPPQSSSKFSLPKMTSSSRYFALIKDRSLSLNLSTTKYKALNWKALKKVFTVSFIFIYGPLTFEFILLNVGNSIKVLR